MNPYAAEIKPSSTEELSSKESSSAKETTEDSIVVRHADAVTATFAVVMFGLAIPLNAYVMLAYADAFDFRNPVLVGAVRWSFPWLPMLFAFGIPALAFYNRKKQSGRRRTMVTLFLLTTTIVLGLTVFVVVSMPIITWLNSM